MACALTQGYLLDCRDGFGGVKTVYFMEYDNATTITQAAGIVTAIAKATGKKFYKYKLIAHTGEGEEALTANRENGTSSNKQSVKFPINKMTTAVRNELLLLTANRLLCVVVDETGRAMLYGAEYGLMVETIGAKTGKALADRNGFEIALGSDEKTLAPEVDAATLLTLETPGV